MPTLIELHEHLNRRRPTSVLELGSGLSTQVIANYAHRNGAQAMTIEHSSYHANRTSRYLGEARRSIKVVLRPLVGDPPVYDIKPPRFDFALIDGPPEGTGGRAATFPWLIESATDDAEIWLDDADRPAEAEAADAWCAEYGWFQHRLALPHGLTRLARTPERILPHADASGVTVTILTGARPGLLTDTLQHLPMSLLETADEVVVLNNGDDSRTADALWGFFEGSEINVSFISTPRMLPIGEAMGVLAGMVQAPYWLHLEDDWRFASCANTWLADAKRLLDEHPNIAQVRLRHSSEPVLTRHQSDGSPIEWRRQFGAFVSNAHLTLNPSLVRSAEMIPLWPSASEGDWQRKAIEAGMRTVAQVSPGAFFHTGGSQSLREVTGG